jgi:hypothetical protein
MLVMKYIYYLKYMARHKWFVFLECYKLNIIWLGVTHDLSKFRPSEFIPYANFFNGNIKLGRDKTGYYKPTNTGNLAFDYAWLEHQHANKHHWQHWCLVQDDDPSVVMLMPYKYMLEMVADWRGAGKAQGTPDTKAWYLEHKNHIKLHEVTRHEVEQLLGVIYE